MVTLGIDISSRKHRTAACTIRWEESQVIVSEPILNCDDAKLIHLIAESDVVGIDAPFGWPIEFVSSVSTGSFAKWTDAVRVQTCFRETDRFVREVTKKWPLSVSADRIAMPAMRVAALLRQFQVSDFSGNGKFYEVYPASSLVRWNLPNKGYKNGSKEHSNVRSEIVQGLAGLMNWLKVPHCYEEDSDALDALVSSLTARGASQGLTFRPSNGQADRAKKEGWIHLPQGYPSCYIHPIRALTQLA